MPAPAKPSLAVSFLAGLLLHTAAVLWLWHSWQAGLRSGWLVWIDLPFSLLWLDAAGPRVLAWSLVAGGLWWGAVTALLTFVVGRMVGRRRPIQ